MYESRICVVAQGAKRVLLGDEMYVYDEPKDIPIFAPIVQREIFYRMLVGYQGARLRQIARAIDWLKGNFTQPLRIDDLAAQVNMSTSTFHHHFREVTAMSPLQYQKWLRQRGNNLNIHAMEART